VPQALLSLSFEAVSTGGNFLLFACRYNNKTSIKMKDELIEPLFHWRSGECLITGPEVLFNQRRKFL